MTDSDRNLLTNLYRINCYSGKEAEMKKFIVDYISKINNSIKIEVDEFAIYITKGKCPYPSLIAHLDEVHFPAPKNVVIVEEELIFTVNQNFHKIGCGGDDKNGIYIALKALNELDNIKIFFPVGEENGGIGSEGCDLNFFDDCRYLIDLDRRGNSDVITSIGGDVICSKLFKKDFMSIAKNYGYKEASGMFTDVDVLKNRNVPLSAINISVGYYKPHSDEEYSIISDIQRTLDLVIEFCRKFTDVYEHRLEERFSKFNFSKLKRFEDDAEFEEDYIKDYYKKIRLEEKSEKTSIFKYPFRNLPKGILE